MQGTPSPAVAPPPPLDPNVIRVEIPDVTGSSPANVYQALRAQRRELANQLENLQDRRRDLSNQLQDPMVGGADRKGLEQRITDVDARIAAVDKQIAASDERIAQQAGVPGAVVETPRPVRNGPPEEVFVLGGMFIVIVLLPLSIALARRIWRRGVTAITSLPAELSERLTRLEQGMDAVAVEVERIGEGQRYMARVLAEDGTLRAIGAGAAEPVEVKAREPERDYRR